jgi:hypothetical protein
MGIISNKKSDTGLAARAKLDLADISDKPRAKKLLRDVLSTKFLDPYLIERAKSIENSLKEKK